MTQTNPFFRAMVQLTNSSKRCRDASPSKGNEVLAERVGKEWEGRRGSNLFRLPMSIRSFTDVLMTVLLMGARVGSFYCSSHVGTGTRGVGGRGNFTGGRGVGGKGNFTGAREVEGKGNFTGARGGEGSRMHGKFNGGEGSRGQEKIKGAREVGAR
ncbi:hypothetical protein EQH57_0025 [Dictyocoela roeselum]|nr:hypothetical protein EQH57_0025 [Dictyocoela roeselum]